MNEDRISTEGLEEAEVRLAALIDVAEEDEGEPERWMVAAHAAVRNEIIRNLRRER